MVLNGTPARVWVVAAMLGAAACGGLAQSAPPGADGGVDAAPGVAPSSPVDGAATPGDSSMSEPGAPDAIADGAASDLLDATMLRPKPAHST